jgi:hypothetical protein
MSRKRKETEEVVPPKEESPKKKRALVEAALAVVEVLERNFNCTVDGCGKSFPDKSQLNKHTKTHSGERKFVCDFPGCGKTFTKSNHMTRHRRTHTDERPFACDVPGYGVLAFAFQSSIQVFFSLNPIRSAAPRHFIATSI